MIHCLLPLLILSADAPAHTASPLALAEEVRQWDFEADDDKNYDRWPDDWKRRLGKGYPRYLKVEIAEDAQPRDGSQPTSHDGPHALRMELDGGAALVYSKAVDVSPLFSYVLKGYIKADGLKHDVAFAAVMFYDQDDKLIETFESSHHKHSSRWTRFQIGPVTPSSDRVRKAVIALHLAPTVKADLTGSAMFDDLWFASLPRVSVETNGRNKLFTHPGDVKITCHVSGISPPDPKAEVRFEPKVRFELQDVDGQTLATHEMKAQANASSVRVFAGSATWSPPIRDFGFYRVLVSISDQTSDPIATNIAVLQPFDKSKQGEFGWSLPRGDKPVALKGLVSLLEDVGIHWVKFPVWDCYEDSGRADDIAWFTERMLARKINMIGMLDQPPRAVRDLFGERGDTLPVAFVFDESEVWPPAVDPVLTRLSLIIRWWQLGDDRDTNFVKLTNLEEKLGAILEAVNRFGQQVSLVLPWRFIDETPAAMNPSIIFSYDANPPLTAEEMPLYMSNASSATAQRWMSMEPLAKSHYSLETRARDLVSRMITAKIQKADGVFVPDPFDVEHGLMTETGEPDTMLLPWRTTAMLLADATYAGSIRLPNGSPNHIFARGDEAVMVVWNEGPIDEVIYLGEQVQQVDVWGNKRPPQAIQEDGFTRQQIKVTRLPTFITGVDLQIALWRMQFRFDKNQIASVFGQEQFVSYSFSNPFDQGASGTYELNLPKVWETTRRSATFKLSANERFQGGLRVMLQPSASSGEQPIRVDFDIKAARAYRFSIYQTLTVGVGDILVELASRLDENGDLIVEQQLTNTTDESASFNCYLTTSTRRRERHQIFNRGRGTTTVQFIYAEGDKLLGETLWLRVEEIDGPRILNYQIVVQE